MSEDSAFFSGPDSLAERHETAAPRLVHASRNGWSEIHVIDRGGRLRALKALKPGFRGDARYETLLRKEYEIGYSLSHTSICEVYGFVSEPGLGNCIEMEWIDGRSLADILAERRPDKATARKWVLQLCDALAYLHAKQIIHRDIKPANLLVTHNGKNLKLIDFGCSDADAFTVLKGPAGTASFAAPELRNGADVDNRADIWSLGKVIALLLPGEKKTAARCTRTAREERFTDVEQVRDALLRPRRWPILLACTALVAAALYLFLHQTAVRTDDPAPETPAADSVDVETVDELFRQATEMIEGADVQ
ncbi:MAG: serine/threonine protein kinase [Bacteroidales bacterium]|nr:serine/threonine protein kinase [Bacteroidales bacterium]